MAAVLTVSLSDRASWSLDELSRSTGKDRSELVRDALRAQVLRETLRPLHDELGPQARESGWTSEDDILRDVS